MVEDTQHKLMLVLVFALILFAKQGGGIKGCLI